ncbi:MAG: serine hydrolase domain-containing protein [Planctomycetota bacterium]
MIFRISTVSLVLLFLMSVASSQEDAKKNPLPAIESINASMQKFVDEGQISGVVTVVGNKGKIVHLGAVGYADLQSEKEMRPFKLFAIASMTKPITATAVMILKEEGKLNLDDKVSQYIPAFKDVKLRDGTAPEREITIRDAITHTSGINGDQVFRTTLKDAVDEIATRPLAFQPGSKWQYSPGMSVAGRIVEIVAEKPFEEFVKERIFTPLKMTNTTFNPDEKQRRQIATIYELSDDKKSLVAVDNRITDPANVTGPNPSGGLFSTGRDLFRFYQMVLSKGQFRKTRILSKESVNEMVSLQTGELKTGFTPGNGWGLGWCVIQEPQGVTGALSSGTFGHGGAFGTQGWVDPQTKTIYVLLFQRNDIGNSDGSEIRKALHEAAKEAIGA